MGSWRNGIKKKKLFRTWYVFYSATMTPTKIMTWSKFEAIIWTGINVNKNLNSQLLLWLEYSYPLVDFVITSRFTQDVNYYTTLSQRFKFQMASTCEPVHVFSTSLLVYQNDIFYFLWVHFIWMIASLDPTSYMLINDFNDDFFVCTFRPVHD